MRIGFMVMNNKSDRFPSDDEVRAVTGKGRLDWFVVLDVWQEGNRDVSQLSTFLMKERGLQPSWARALASQYVSRRI
jgi:hypothetical protein